MNFIKIILNKKILKIKKVLWKIQIKIQIKNYHHYHLYQIIDMIKLKKNKKILKNNWKNIIKYHKWILMKLLKH